MPTRMVKRSRKSTKPSDKPAKISRTRKPKEMSLDQWQTELRRQFGREQAIKIRNLGDDPVFSEFSVTNPATRRTYRVVIRGEQPGVNFCSCPDYAVNTLGTCKHIEATLHRLRRRHAAALRKGHLPNLPNRLNRQPIDSAEEPEEKIDTMIERKKKVFEKVIGTGEGWLTELSRTELKELFALREEAVAR